jgi:quinol-cytochrome oxidoreductase complex cytochrome b subunit
MSRSIVTPTKPTNPVMKLAGKALQDVDERYHPAGGLRKQLNKVFPTHWSFLLGEIALYSFIVLLLSGTYLALFFDPSMTEVQYNGTFDNLRGIFMSRAFESSLNISFDVRGGLFVRQLHHWAANLFMAAMAVHMLRIFFTGAFRKPRETNWILGMLLLVLGGLEGFTGYSLPDDLLSGTGIRAAMSGGVLATPVIGTWLHWLIFGGEFPGTVAIPRFYTLHILLVPGIILGLIAVHLGLVWYQKHTQFPGVRRKETNVVGVRIMPVFAIKGGGFFAVVVGVLALLAGIFQINPIWNFGPYSPAQVSAGSQPDGRPAAAVAGLGDQLRAPVPDPCGVLPADGDRRGDHRHADVPVPGTEADQGQRPPQPAATAEGRAGAHQPRRDGPRVPHRGHHLLRQRHHREQVRHLAERDDVGGPDRHPDRAAAGLLHHLPDLPRPAAGRPGDPGPRCGDRHHQAAAAR